MNRLVTRQSSRSAATARAIAAMAVLAVLMVAVPLGLAATIGNPLAGLSDLAAGDVSDAAVIAVLASVTWLAWAQFALAVVVETIAGLRHATVPRRIPAVLPGQQQLARMLVSAVLVLVPTFGPITGAAHAASAKPVAVSTTVNPAIAAPAVHARTSMDFSRAMSASATGHDARSLTEDNRAGAPVRAYRIAKGGPDTYWDLAQAFLGDGQRWQQIWELNEGRRQDDGVVLSSPGPLRIGWEVLVPVNVDTAREGAPEASDRTPSSSDVDQPLASMVSQGLGAGAGLLAASSLIALLRHRRRQFRYRRPGQAIASTPPEVAGVEKALTFQGSQFLADAAWLDESLRTLGQSLTDAGSRLPEVLAVRMGAHVLELTLADPGVVPADPPSPWTRAAVTGRWQLKREDCPPDSEAQARLRRRQFAPYPTLVSIGYSDQGDYWLLDLEQIGSLRLSGDRERCLDLARFVAADLAHNVWSEQLDVTLAGFGSEVADLNPERVTYEPDASQALAHLQSQLQANLKGLADTGLDDTLEGRQKDIIADQWMPQVLLIDEASVAADASAAQTLRELAVTLRRQRGRSGIVLLVVGQRTGDVPDDPENVTVNEEGHLEVPALGLPLHAQRLRARDAAQLTQLMAAAGSVQDQDMPAARGNAPWDAVCDAAGAPILESVPSTSGPGTGSATALQDWPVTTPEPSRRRSRHAMLGEPDGSPAEDSCSVLRQPATSVLAASATTARDVQVLAPSVPADLRRHIERADPSLDQDLASWHASDTARPRLSLLGPLQVRARGALPADRPRVAWHTEVVAYLGVHPRGVTAEQLGTALWPESADVTSKSKLRNAVYLVRKWLGDDPATGESYLPLATSAGHSGLGVYRIDGLLVDADLFRRLRLRGVAHGAAGIVDLEAALQLVTGPPFDQRRPDGYSWLIDLPLDHEYTAMIVDVAHLVATHHLVSGRPDLAAAAARVSLLAASHDDVALLDLLAASDAQGHHAESRVLIRQILANHDAEVEEDLPPRTAEILHRRRWIDK